MATPLERKLTTEQIRRRFDDDVERFSDLSAGQRATIDAPLAMELITSAAIACNPGASTVLDIGCGAGNSTLKLLQGLRPLDCDLVDLSLAMLQRARARIRAVNPGKVRTFQGDIREVDLPPGRYDIVLAAAVLHHLRDDADWESVFSRVFALVRPGGSLWVTDLVAHEIPSVEELMCARYGDYLESIGGKDHRSEVFRYIDVEDSPRPLTFQLDLLRRVGFCEVDILHKNSCFAAFGARKPPTAASPRADR